MFHVPFALLFLFKKNGVVNYLSTIFLLTVPLSHLMRLLIVVCIGACCALLSCIVVKWQCPLMTYNKTVVGITMGIADTLWMIHT